MSNRWRRIWAWVVMLGLVVIGLAIASYVWTAKNKPGAVSVVAGLVAVLVAAGSLMGALRKGLGPAQPPSEETLNLVADRLAKQVEDQWMDAAGDRGLQVPAPMPVSWHWCDGVTNRPADAVRSSRFEPLPRFAPASTQVVTVKEGGRTNLLDVFGGLGSGRIVILGEPGSGKSAAAILLLLDVLKYRRGQIKGPLDSDERALVPVPVLFTLRGWDPRTKPVREWLVRELTRTYPLLLASGRAVTRELISSNRLAFFLDGLDELPQDLRGPALEALSTQATFRLLTLSRSKEMLEAVGHRHLGDAAALELVPVPAKVAADYLTSTQRDPLPGQWKRLIDYLRDQPDSVVSVALNSPLTLSLVRDTYEPEGNPAELLDASRLGKAADVEDHLLDRVLPAAYTWHPGHARPRYSLDTATRGLAYIATRMNQDHTRDLAWWKVPRWVPAAPGPVTTGLLLGLPFGLVFGLLFEPAFGLVFGLVAMLLEVLGQAGFLEPLGPPKRLGTLRRRTALSRHSLRAGPAIGVAFGIFASIFGGLVDGLVVGLVGGLAVWLVLAVGRPGPEESPSDPIASWRGDRNYGLILGLVVGLAPGIGFGLTLGLGLGGGLAAGIAAGLGFGLLGGIFYANTWRTALASGQLRLSGHTPLRLMRFLEDAHTRNVLRTVGPIYQFRHASLQDHLASVRMTDPRLWAGLADGSLAAAWTLDPSRSTIHLRSGSMWGLAPVKGSFGRLYGEAVISGTGEVSGSITTDSASIDTKIKKRDARLRSADFFDSDAYPHIVFKAQQVALTSEGAAVTGTLQVRDRTQPLTFLVAVSASDGEVIQLDAEVLIDRSDFGLTWNHLGMVSMKTTITIRAVFTRN